MRASLPLQVELVDFLRVFGVDQLRNVLELLPELQYGLLENSDLPGRPVLEHIRVSQWVYEHI